jgi:hypothetical protein
MDDRSRQGLARWRWLGWVITLIALFFVGRWLLRVDHSVWASLRHVRLDWLLLSLAIFQFWFILRYWAWERIIARHGYTDARHANIKMWIMSEMYRYIPGNVWSFAGRWKGATTGGVAAKSTVHALMVEAGGLLSGAAIVTLVVLGQPYMWLAPFVAGAVVLFGPAVIRLMIRIIRHDTIIFPRQENAVLLLLYMFVWMVFGAAHVALFRAMAPTIGSVPDMTAMSVSVISWFIGYVTIITPMGLGVREAVFSQRLAAVTSIPVATAGLLAVISRVWLVVSEIVFLGIAILWSAIRGRD